MYSVHLPLIKTTSESNSISHIYGDYRYFHYGCDGFDDRGWGCGYRTLQTICSWLLHNMEQERCKVERVPSLMEIQKILVRIGDKEESFIGSRDWIGSYEVGSFMTKYF